MATATEHLPSPQPPVKRRKFLEISALAAVAGTVTTLIHHEAQVASEGYFTVDGVRYLPLYEKHSLGPQTEIPDDTDGLFAEYLHDRKDKSVKVNIINLDPLQTEVEETDIIQTQYDEPPGYVIGGISNSPGGEKMVSKARKLKIPIGVGDAEPKTPEGIEALINGLNEVRIDKIKFYGGILASIIGQIPPHLQKIILSKLEPPGDAGWTRREALIKLGKAFVSIGGNVASALGAWLALGTEQFKGASLLDLPDPAANHAEAALSRFLIRLNGLVTHAHPEDPIIFTRNLVMALKMKDMGEMLKQNKQLPLIGFNLGRAHGGIEDFLGLPSDILRTMIAHINKEYVKGSIDHYGLENFCSIRLLQANDLGNFEDIDPILDDKLMKLLQ